MSWSQVLFFSVGITPVFAGNISSANRYAYDANAGWIDFAPSSAIGVTVGNYFLNGQAYAANYGWIDFGSGPSNKTAYAQSGGDTGVNVNPVTGALTGYAYSANTGWINFGWSGTNDPNRPLVEVNSGTLTGYAYSANTGWISIANVKSTSLAITDSDGDGIDDAWEMLNFTNLTTAGIGTDFDKDGQSDAAEFIANTLPKDNQSWLRVTAYSVNSGTTTSTITFTSSPLRLYKVQTSTNLVSWADVSTNLGAEFRGSNVNPTTTAVCTHATSSPRFHRVIARKY